MSEVMTRRAAASDYEVVSALLAELGRPPTRADTKRQLQALYLRHIGRVDTASLVAELSGKVVGFLALERRERLGQTAPEAWVPELVVTEAARRQGAGRALMQAALAEAKAWGCANLVAEIAAADEGVRSFFHAQGMHEGRLLFAVTL